MINFTDLLLLFTKTSKKHKHYMQNFYVNESLLFKLIDLVLSLSNKL